MPLTDNQIQYVLQCLEQNYPVRQQEIDDAMNIIWKYIHDNEIPKISFAPKDKYILRCMITFLQQRLREEFSRENVFTPHCLALQEKMLMAKDVLNDATYQDKTRNLGLLCFTMAFDMDRLKVKKDVPLPLNNNDIDTSAIVFNNNCDDEDFDDGELPF